MSAMEHSTSSRVQTVIGDPVSAEPVSRAKLEEIFADIQADLGSTTS